VAATVFELRQVRDETVPGEIRGTFRPTVVVVSTALRDESPGFHHVVCRGNNRRRIYVDDHDRMFFCATVDRLATKYHWRILAWCLMDNHYHLVIEVTDRGLAAGMCELNSGYACTFNVRHGRVNHLFGKRYFSRRIRTDAQMLNVVRYIVQNPRAAGGSRPLQAYRWTSYAATIGLAIADIRLARDELLSFFGRDPTYAREWFRVFCTASGFPSLVRWQPP
jgi:putative transposase